MTSTTTDVASLTPDQYQLIDRNFALHEQFSLSMIEDDEVADEVPNGVTLVLIPDKDPALAETNLQSALDSAHRGMNVYIRHVFRVGEEFNERGDPVYSPYPGGKKATDKER